MVPHLCLYFPGMEVDPCCCSPFRSHFFALTYPFVPLCAPRILACSLPLSPPPPQLTRQVSAVGWEDSIHLVLDSDELLRNPFLGTVSEGGGAALHLLPYIVARGRATGSQLLVGRGNLKWVCTV